MVPKHQNRRLMAILLCGLLLAGGAILLFSALKQNTQFFYNPSEILAEGFEAQSSNIRIGGLVLESSVIKGSDLTTTFKIADFPEEGAKNNPDVPYITVTYEGVLPDLFREGQGVVVTAQLISSREMVASDILAKHDENYQPKKN